MRFVLFMNVYVLLCGTMSVSYTHLDVYKRQPTSTAQVCKMLPLKSLIYSLGSL